MVGRKVSELCTLVALLCTGHLFFQVQWSIAIEADQVIVSKSEPACAHQEFYHANRCRNCSDLNYLFYNYQQWLLTGEERNSVNKVVGISAETNARNKLNLAPTTTTITSNKAATNGDGGNGNNKAFERPKFSGIGTVDGDVVEDQMLSRLISNVDAQDQSDYIDSTGAGRDSAGDSGYIELGDQFADTPINTRQTQKLAADFARTSLIGNELIGLIDQCRQYQNMSACQMWSNLCVMTMYSYSDTVGLTSPTPSPSSAPSAIRQYPSSYDSLLTGRDGNYNRQLEIETTARLHAESGEPVSRAGSPRTKPWQKCRQFSPTSICNSLREWHRVERKPEIQNIYSLEDPQTKINTGLSFRLNQPFQLLAYRYSFDGRPLSVQQFGLTDIASFCALPNRQHRDGPPNGGSDDNSVRMGKNMRLSCRFAPAQLMNHLRHFNETVFIDLYIAYPANGVMFLKPVPILIENLLYNGFQVNRKKTAKDSSRLKLVHRFFFHSTFIIESSQLDNREFLELNNDKKQSQQVVLYAKSAILDLKFRQQDKGNAQLSSLMLVIDYGHFYQSSHNIGRDAMNTTASNQTASWQILETQVAISQSLIDMQSFKRDLDLVLTILSILSSIWSLIRCYNIQKCYGLVKLELETLIRFVLIGCDTLANLFGLVNFSFLGYLFLMLKFQPTVQVLAPNEELESALLLNFKLALLFKLVGFSHKLYVHLNADIFFIDWEKPKMFTSSQILSHQQFAAHYNHSQQMEHPQQITSNKSNNQATNANPFIIERPNFLYGYPSQQSSFWRPYTIISRWLQLQTMRRQDLTLQLMLFVCSIGFFQITNLATADLNLDLSWPNINQSPPSANLAAKFACQSDNWLQPQLSATFRLLVLAIVYVTLSMCQILYKTYISEPMLRSSVREFVDLCSVANVSLFCMLYPRFGYYIHGRNANGSSECGVAEMNALLEREELDLCSKRGLAPNSDKQTFLMILPRIINDHYRKLLYSYDSANNQQLAADNAIARQLRQNAAAGNNNSNGNDNIGDSKSFSATGNGLKRLSALNLSSSSSAAASSFSSNRALIESITLKNKAINVFLINFLEHVYKDIDYSIRDRRRFENFLFDVDFDETSELTASGGLILGQSRSTTGTGAGTGRFNGPLISGSSHHQPPTMIGNKLTAATLCEDHQDSFTRLFWLGLEFDLIFLELFSLLILDCWLDQSLIITTGLVWILHQSFKSIYIYLAKHNLVCKALVDEKFLLLA